MKTKYSGTKIFQTSRDKMRNLTTPVSAYSITVFNLKNCNTT